MEVTFFFCLALQGMACPFQKFLAEKRYVVVFLSHHWIRHVFMFTNSSFGTRRGLHTLHYSSPHFLIVMPRAAAVLVKYFQIILIANVFLSCHLLLATVQLIAVPPKILNVLTGATFIHLKPLSLKFKVADHISE